MKMIKNQIKLFAIIAGAMFSMLFYNNLDGEDKQLKNLGSTFSKPINSGFTFIKGKYINSPYIISRQGLKICINGTKVYEWTQWPLPPKSVDKDPGIPKELTKDSKLDDVLLNNTIDKKFRYLHGHFPEDIAMRKMVEFYEKLPCMKKVTTEKRGNFRFVTIYLKNGDKEDIDLSGYTPESVSSGDIREKDVIDILEETKQEYEQQLKEGECLFIFNACSFSFCKEKSEKDLKLIIEILQSKRKSKEKIKLLQRLTVFPPDATPYLELLDDFKSNEQLKERISKLIKAANVAPRKFKDIPKYPPWINETEEKKKLPFDF